MQIYVSTASAVRGRMKKTSVSLNLHLFVVVLLIPGRCRYFTSNTRTHTYTHSAPRRRCHRCCTESHTPLRALSSHSINRPTHANTLQGIHPPTKQSPNTQITHTHTQSGDAVLSHSLLDAIKPDSNSSFDVGIGRQHTHLMLAATLAPLCPTQC